MPREVFVAGQVLTAAELNVVSDQSVMVFAGTASRGSAIPSPSEGMVTYLEDSNQVQVYNGSGFTPVGGVLQVVSALKVDTSSTTSTTYTDVASLSVSITPSSTSSKVLIIANVTLGVNSQAGYVQLVRDSTAIGNPTIPGGSDGGFGFLNTFSIDDRLVTKHGISFLDSPNTTSATTYKIQFRSPSGATMYVNRSDASATQLTSSDITVMEVAG